MSNLTPEQSAVLLKLIENPPPGSKIAAKKEGGVDLTLLYANLQLSVTERCRRWCSIAMALQAAQAAGRLVFLPKKHDNAYTLLELEALEELRRLTDVK